MKKLLFLGTIGALAIMPQYAHASTVNAACLAAKCLDEVEYGNTLPPSCVSSSESCYGGVRISSCNTCTTGYTRTLQYTTVDGCSNQISYYSCVKDSGDDDGNDCDGTCENCESSDWGTLAAGYQTQTTKTCNTSTCVCSSSMSYRCAAGYYGTATNFSCQTSLYGTTCNSTDCQPCPAAEGVYTDANRTTQAYGTVAAGNGNAKTACYLPGGTYYDASGAFDITTPLALQKCSYSE